jgi:hypothetical protein
VLPWVQLPFSDGAASSAGAPNLVTTSDAPDIVQHHEPTARWEPGRGDRPSLGRDLARGWPLILLATLILIAAGVATGLRRDPVYTAETRMAVGSINASAQSVPGYVAAAETLASSYSRIAASDQVMLPLARRVGLPPGEVEERLEAAPVPESPVLRVEAEGPSERDAIALSEAASSELRDYVADSEANDARVSEALQEYRERSREAVRLETRLEQRRAIRRVNPAAVPLEDVQALQSAAEVARLRAQGAGTQYQALRERAIERAGLTVVRRPRGASSDRNSVTQQLAFIGLVGGLAIGSGLALLRARRRRRVTA